MKVPNTAGGKSYTTIAGHAIGEGGDSTASHPHLFVLDYPRSGEESTNYPSLFRCFSGKISPPELIEPAISSNWQPIGHTAPTSTPHTRSIFLVFSCAVLGRTDPAITTQVILQFLSQKHTVSTTLSRLCLLRRFTNHDNTGSDRSRRGRS